MEERTVRAVLFDLDGTLLDTASDLVFALNRIRATHDLTPLSAAAIKPVISQGAKAMIKYVLNIEEEHPNFPQIREQFFGFYQEHLADSTQLFPEMESVLEHLEHLQIPWGIVTNKLTKYTLLILQALQLNERAGCVICGDTLTQYKPHPEPILHACNLLQHNPNECIYIGDSITDVLASKAAGTQSLVALYGYIGANEDPFEWKADGYINRPKEILDWVNR